MKLDKTKVYSLEDLTSEERKKIYNHLCNIQEELKLISVGEYDILEYETYNEWVFYHKNTGFIKYKYELTNAKELFYTLANVAIVVNDLTKEQKNNLESVFVSHKYFRKPYTENKELISYNGNYKYEITYEKFMELFSEPQHEVTEKPKHYSKGIDTFARMEANCTKEECLAFAKGNIDKYNFRTKGQDLEDYKKIISYANWAIKLLKDEK